MNLFRSPSSRSVSIGLAILRIAAGAVFLNHGYQKLFVFGLSGVMPALWSSCLLLMISRVLLGAEFAVQETLLMRLVPDKLRGRVSTTDRAGEMLIWTFSTAVAGWSLHLITPRTLTLIAGFLSGVSGLVWLVLFTTQAVRLPRRLVHRLD